MFDPVLFDQSFFESQGQSVPFHTGLDNSSEEAILNVKDFRGTDLLGSWSVSTKLAGDTCAITQSF